MTAAYHGRIYRRNFVTALSVLTVSAMATPALALSMDKSTEIISPASGSTRNNISSFRLRDWQDYFSDLHNGAILADLTSRAVHFWSEDQSVYRLYPSSVPLNEELTKRGRTEVIKKVVDPVWIPTVDELRRNPDWPKRIEGGVADNPLGVRALYLDWPAYRIHGTHDTRKIGRRSSNGCIGLYNEHILELYGFAKIGAQVLFI